MVKTTLALLFLYTLFMAAATAPSLSSAAVMRTGISSPVLAEFKSGDSSDSKGRITPSSAHKGTFKNALHQLFVWLYLNSPNCSTQERYSEGRKKPQCAPHYSEDSNTEIMTIPGFSVCKKSLRLRRFRWTMMRKATASSTRMITLTERHSKYIFLSLLLCKSSISAFHTLCRTSYSQGANDSN